MKAFIDDLIAALTVATSAGLFAGVFVLAVLLHAAYCARAGQGMQKPVWPPDAIPGVKVQGKCR